MNVLEKSLNDLEVELSQNRIKVAFSEFLVEMAKNYTTLYHFTTPAKIESILRDGKLTAGSEGYVSFTRDFRLVDDKNYFNTGEYIVRLSFDGKGISENIKVQPIRDKRYPDEREEGTLKSVPLKYLKQIDIILDTRVFPRTSIEALESSIKKKSKVEVNLLKVWNLVK